MKIQCSVCEGKVATVLCCADEAALCGGCDEKVHAANKLASKHQRVPLSSSSSQMPKCDICQETVGYFFCLEDRALLCRKCDVAIHTANSLVSAHQRFLLTGVTVGIEAPGVVSGKDPRPAAEKTTSVSPGSHQKQSGASSVFTQTKPPYAGASDTEGPGFPQWSLDELLAPAPVDYNPTLYFLENGPSKAENKKLGEAAGSLKAADAELEGDECLGQVPDSHFAVPQICSPQTASGLYWPKNAREFSKSSSFFVPDVGSPPLRSFESQRKQPHFSTTKRRKYL